MPNFEAMQEAAKRGILPDDLKPLYEEAVKRGLIQDVRVGVGEDIAKTIPSKLAQGTMSLMGAFGDAREMGVDLARWGLNKLGASPEASDRVAGFTRYLNPMAFFPTTEQIRKPVEQMTGPFYEPKTKEGQYAGTIAEFAPAMALPGGAGKTLIKKAIQKGVQTVAPAVASETAGQYTKGTKWEPLARAGAAVATAPFTGGRSRSISNKQMRAEASAGFESAKHSGVALKPETYSKMLDEAYKAAAENGYFAKNQTKLKNAFDEMERWRGSAVDLDSYKNLRTVLNSAFDPSNPQMNNAMKAARNRMDALLSRVKVNGIVANVPPQEAIRTLRKSISDWRRVKRLDDIEAIRRDADLRGSAKFTQSGSENVLRHDFLREATNKRRMRGWTGAEMQQIERVVGGTKGGNAARMVGKYAPTSPLAAASGGGMAGAAGGAVGFLLGGPAGAAIGALLGASTAAGTGALMRKIATMSTEKQIQILEELVKVGPDALQSDPRLAKMVLALEASTRSQRQGVTNTQPQQR
jgi:hypothetical protein